MKQSKQRVEDAISSKKTLKEVLFIITEEALRLTEATSSSVIILDQATNELVFFVTGGQQKKSIEELRFPATKGITGAVLKEGRGQYINDPHNHPQFYDEIEKICGFATTNILVVPMVIDGVIFGAINVLNKPAGFTEYDLISIDAFSVLAADALMKSKKLVDEIKSRRFLAKRLEANIDFLIAYNR